MARKKPHEEHENHERWLVSYADFITLLFAFFVVMYSISSVNEGKYRVLSDSLIAVFESSPKAAQPIDIGKSKIEEKTGKKLRQAVLQSPNPGPSSERLPDEIPLRPIGQSEASPYPSDSIAGVPRGNIVEKMRKDMEAALAPLIAQELLRIRTGDNWVEVEMTEDISFYPRTARLKESALPVLEAVTNIFKDIHNSIQIEGFTDNQPIGTDEFPTNWELSSARAATVVRYFQSQGIKPERMAAIGFGEFQPIADNNTEEGRKKNRRIVMVLSTNESPLRVPYEPEPEETIVPEKPAEQKPAAQGADTKDSKVAPQIPVAPADILNEITKPDSSILNIEPVEGIQDSGNIPMLIQPVSPPPLLDKTQFPILPQRPNIIPDIRGSLNNNQESKETKP